MESYPKDKAVEIVKDYLMIDGFIESNKDNIIEHLKEFVVKNKSALSLEENKDIPEGIKFLSETLPFMSGIINVGAKTTNYVAAKKEVEKIYHKENGENLPGSIIYILSVYTFIYILEEIIDDEDLKKYLKNQALWLCNTPKNISI